MKSAVENFYILDRTWEFSFDEN
ncbi:hypothetical protein CGSHi22121_09640 [Haemophilus influenzae 22.1-21]|uniref:Uncharacterized protein n=1 Tax=Haemophilus influenzae R3021 TaxID=375432 RepID=A4N3B6_HAEIF|nr:hypothetical protein CGSHi22121_09640 [Haemophilus influenzae 22.1-21]EDJ91199.1 hypothetical protein CGSHi22421_01734 [Haemophilus influenzae R3021]EDK09953.1 hypothetical protein CGSHiHH_06375 [Haemophilus influenzae PittHH]EDK11106.1 hypothetical protein CGSHiII_08966 [Haemophilus influenzae PittII]